MSQDEAYFTGSEYEVFSVFQQMNPSHMSFFCAFRGLRAPDFTEGFSYCELGCGQGYHLLMMAALYPQGRFVGIDMSEAQIARARALAAETGVDNVTFVHAAFAGMAAEPDGESFDVMALHGVWTWVSHATRREILSLVDRLLKPAGLFYVSANVQPGWGATAPFQRLLLEQWRSSDERDPQALRDAFLRFCALKPKALLNNPKAAAIFDKAMPQGVNYFAHEFLNGAWEPILFRDLTSDLEPLGIAHAAGGRVRDLLDLVTLTADQRGHLATIEEAGWRETLKDFFRDENFRQDYFLRGGRELSVEEQYQRIASCPVALVSRANAEIASVKGAEGPVPIDPVLRRAFANRLDAGPALVHELLSGPAAEEAGLGAALHVLLMMLSVGAVEIGLTDGYDALVRDRARRFNEAVLMTAVKLPAAVQLASPVLRAPVMTTLKERTYLCALLAGRDPVKAILALGAEPGVTLTDGAKPLPTAEQRTAAELDYELFKAERLPLFAQLGIVGFQAGQRAQPRRDRRRA